MKAKILTFAILSALSAGAMAGGYSRTQDPNGPNAKVPDNAPVAAPAPAYAAPAPAYGTPANPPIANSTTVQQQGPVWVTSGVAQSGPGATDKTRPGYPDDNTGHSSWDVGTSSAGS